MTVWRLAPHSRLRALRVADVAGLPWCGACPARRTVTRDLSWAEAAVAEWEMCGVGLFLDGEVEGYALVSPALHVPRTHPLARGANADAAALLVVNLSSEVVAGRQLVQGLAARLVDQRNITAVDAAWSGSGSCERPSAEWLDSCGFRPLGDGVRARLELGGTRSWLPSVSTVVRHMISAVRTPASPNPVAQSELGLTGTRQVPSPSTRVEASVSSSGAG